MSEFPEIPNAIVEFVLRHGKRYKPAVCPAFVVRGEVGTCFDTSAVNALNGKLRYVEGIVMHPKYSGVKILHGWLTDGEHAFDPTWRAEKEGVEQPVPSTYIGVEMEIVDVARFMMSTKYACVLANAWRDPLAAADVHPSIPTDRV